MKKNSQLGVFASFFHQDFGDSPQDTLENNITSFFSSPEYVNGQAFTKQIEALEKIIFSAHGRGAAWKDLGGFMWMKELEKPETWEIIKSLAQDFHNHQVVLGKRDEFDAHVHRLLASIKAAQK
jgi:hypothetical protein